MEYTKYLQFVDNNLLIKYFKNSVNEEKALLQNEGTNYKLILEGTIKNTKIIYKDKINLNDFDVYCILVKEDNLTNNSKKRKHELDSKTKEWQSFVASNLPERLKSEYKKDCLNYKTINAGSKLNKTLQMNF